jgi:3-phosphoshikimate 1-carboxyvinyltransferase
MRIIHPSGLLTGKIRLPASKSISNRALIIQAVAGSNIAIHNLSDAADTVTLNKLIHSGDEELDCGEGGTTLRFLLALLALQGREHIITGSKRLKQRPVSLLVTALNTLGASIEYIEKEGCLPLKIHPSSLHGGRIQMDASVSSQFISAMMLIAPALDEGLTIELTGTPSSFSYILMTAALIQRAGVHAEIRGNEIAIPPSAYQPYRFIIEPDWSSASYWLEAASFSRECNLTLEGLQKDISQGDAVAADLITHFGVHCFFGEEGMTIEKNHNKPANTFHHNFTNCPDLVPAFAMTCALHGTEGYFSGTQTLAGKESDRGKVLSQLIRKLGGEMENRENALHIFPKALKGSSELLPVHDDHRMAMCLAPLALRFPEIRVADPDVVQKSYPAFWDDLLKTGFELSEK